MSNVEVHLLADHPELTHLLATWFYEQWGRSNPDLSVGRIERNLQERLNRDRLPLTLVTFEEEQPVASATLKIREMDTYPQYPYWLGSVYVLPEHRGRGIGSHLAEHAAAIAQRLGVRELCLYTPDREKLYARLGWVTMERTVYRGEAVVIMRRTLEVRRGFSTLP